MELDLHSPYMHLWYVQIQLCLYNDKRFKGTYTYISITLFMQINIHILNYTHTYSI